MATRRGQGQRDSDYCWTVEGELVWFPIECAADRDNIDGGCGCRRAWAGLGSYKATTTAAVEDRDITFEEYVGPALGDAIEKMGWKLSPAEVENAARELLELAARFDLGAVVERRGELVQVREAG